MANQIVIAGGQVGSTNWINTEVADNEYPVMGSGIKAAIDAAGGGGDFAPMVISFEWGEGDTGTPDKTWEEIVEAIGNGTRHFALQSADTFYGFALWPEDGDPEADSLIWSGVLAAYDNEDGTATLESFYMEYSPYSGFGPSSSRINVTTASP